MPCIRFSQWLKENLPTGWRNDFNIIKSNIEGAEWEVWHDLVETGMVSAFDLWLGAREGHDGWADDLQKIDGMHDKAEILTAAFEKAGITTYRFSAWDKNIPNSDIPAVLHDTLAASQAG